jgi:hypothetical protein
VKAAGCTTAVRKQPCIGGVAQKPYSGIEVVNPKSGGPAIGSGMPGSMLTVNGYDAIGLNGVWCATAARINEDGPLTLGNH